MDIGGPLNLEMKTRSKGKPVDMLDKEGEFVKSFPSIHAAARHFLGSVGNIRRALKRQEKEYLNKKGEVRKVTYKYAYGHQWRYSNENKSNGD